MRCQSSSPCVCLMVAFSENENADIKQVHKDANLEIILSDENTSTTNVKKEDVPKNLLGLFVALEK